MSKENNALSKMDQVLDRMDFDGLAKSVSTYYGKTFTPETVKRLFKEEFERRGLEDLLVRLESEESATKRKEPDRDFYGRRKTKR